MESFTIDSKIASSLSTFFLMLTVLTGLAAQSVNTRLPDEVEASGKYLFYLHGGIVQAQGVNAVSDLFGPYEYLAILDSLAGYGYQVISEVRPKDTKEIEYAAKVVRQIDTLQRRGVAIENIIIVGASLGAYITIEAAHLLQSERMNYALLGLCSDYALEYFQKYKKSLCGNFLSIYESTDQKGSCKAILDHPACKAGYLEIRLSMGIGHGFLYRPYRQWIDPLMHWLEKERE